MPHHEGGLREGRRVPMGSLAWPASSSFALCCAAPSLTILRASDSSASKPRERASARRRRSAPQRGEAPRRKSIRSHISLNTNAQLRRGPVRASLPLASRWPLVLLARRRHASESRGAPLYKGRPGRAPLCACRGTVLPAKAGNANFGMALPICGEGGAVPGPRAWLLGQRLHDVPPGRPTPIEHATGRLWRGTCRRHECNA